MSKDYGSFSCKPNLKVAIYGVGWIGGSIARLLLTKKGLEIVGAVDFAQAKVGRDLGEIVGAEKPLGVKVTKDAEELFSTVKPDVVVHATSSYFRDVYPQLEEIVKHGVNVVSTCEELSYPYFSSGELAAKLDALAKKHKVAVLGTGVNPGFVMDTLPIVLSGVCQEIRNIKVERVMDASTRRMPFQKKIGAGLTVDEFREKIRNKQITGHVGLEQSVAMIADALGWSLQAVELGVVEPVVAEKPVKSKEIKVERGKVAGLRQSARGIMHSKPVITLLFEAYIGAEEEYDSITIEGVPKICEKISPCVHGDLATAAIVVNMIPKVVNSEPGLKTMKDLPLPSAVLGDIRRTILRFG
ncbi:dihydrodipicolinate reductase [Candidatus Bathyarchaeota archaeon]|nr:dihydrodipicolinate reductase [Candidatus Bathyarchaeota archaeon]